MICCYVQPLVCFRLAVMLSEVVNSTYCARIEECHENCDACMHSQGINLCCMQCVVHIVTIIIKGHFFQVIIMVIIPPFFINEK